MLLRCALPAEWPALAGKVWQIMVVLIADLVRLQTYTDTAKEKAVNAADFTAAKLQDLKVGLVGQEGAAKAEGKAPDSAAVSEQVRPPA